MLSRHVVLEIPYAQLEGNVLHLQKDRGWQAKLKTGDERLPASDTNRSEVTIGIESRLHRTKMR